MKKLFRIGLLSAIVVTTFSAAALVTLGVSASPVPASAASSKNKNKNKNKNGHTKEMKRNQKKLILKGRHERHKEKNT